MQECHQCGQIHQRSPSIIPAPHLAPSRLGLALTGLGLEAALAGGASWLGGFAGFGSDQRALDELGQALERFAAIMLLRALVTGDDEDPAVIRETSSGERAEAVLYGIRQGRRT